MATHTPLTRVKIHRSVVLDDPARDVRELHVERMRAALPLLGPKSYFCRTSASVLYGLPLWHEGLERFGPALAMADAALRLGASRTVLLAEVATGRGCRHCTEAVLRADPRSESPYESWARAIRLQNHLPLPTLQKGFFDANGFIGRVDFYWKFAALCGEFDGEVSTGSF